MRDNPKHLCVYINLYFYNLDLYICIIFKCSHLCVQVRVENLTKERDILRQAESRLNREKEAMLAEQRNQNLLLTNFKSIQVH